MSLTEFARLSLALARESLAQLVSVYAKFFLSLRTKVGGAFFVLSNWIPRVTSEPPFIAPPPLFGKVLDALWESFQDFAQDLANLPLSVWGKFVVGRLRLPKGLSSRVVRLDTAIVGMLEFIIDEGRQATTTNLPGSFQFAAALEGQVSRYGKWREALHGNFKKFLPSAFKLFQVVLKAGQLHLRISGQILLFIVFWRVARSLQDPLLLNRWKGLALSQDSKIVRGRLTKAHRVNVRSGPDR